MPGNNYQADLVNGPMLGLINQKLTTLPSAEPIDGGLEAARTILQLLVPQKAIKPAREIKLTSLRKYISPGQEKWFQPHPNFADTQACFNLASTELLEANFFYLKQRRRQFINGAAHFGHHYGDQSYTSREGYRVGLDFFLNPGGGSIQVVVTNRGRIRVVELQQKLNSTQRSIFQTWQNNIRPQTSLKNLHHGLWDSLARESVNDRFYKDTIELFQQIVSHFQLKHPDFDQKQTNAAKKFATLVFNRLIFCWFLREKGLIPRNSDFFNPGRFQSGTDYYNQKLKQLFFATLNTPQAQRVNYGGSTDQQIPYLNGGLFDCQEIDQTADRLKITFPEKFFEAIYQHFQRFNFTTDESNEEYEEVAVDPEMLGRIFESLLAEYISSDGQSDRKKKGAYYTPREIVNYMCRESLRNYLLGGSRDRLLYQQTVNDLIDQNNISWFGHDGKNSKYQKNSRDYRQEILKKLEKLTVLDPACGSGAFPIGMMQLIISLYSRLQKNDFDTYKIKEKILRENIFGADIDPIAVDIARLRAWLSLIVDYKLPDGNNLLTEEPPLPNLDFKFVLANSLKTLNNQPDLFDAAVSQQTAAFQQIRSDWFKLSPVTADRTTDYLKNRQKIVTEFKQSKQELIDIINQTDSLSQLAVKLTEWDPFSWNSFSTQDSSQWWFDAQFMLGVKNGFDIVIGNPPYIQLQKNNSHLGDIYKDEGYVCFARTGDIYQLFYELGLNLLNSGGTLCYITSNKWMRAKYGSKLRELLGKKSHIIQIIDLGPGQFKEATVDTNILLTTTSTAGFRPESKSKVLTPIEGDLNNKSGFLDFNPPGDGSQWLILSPIEKQIKDKIEKIGTPLKDWDISIYYGIKTGCNDAFIIDNETKEKLVKEDPKSAEILKPILRGRDIKRYRADWAGRWIIDTHNGFGDTPKVDIADYPIIKKHLDQHWAEISSRQDKGDTPYNLRNCAYYEEFKRDKIIYPETSGGFMAHYDTDRFFIDKTCFIVTGENLPFLTVFLNSKLNNFYYSKIAGMELGNGLQTSKIYVQEIPVVRPNHKISQLAHGCLSEMANQSSQDKLSSSTIRVQAELDQIIFDIYQLNDQERNTVEKFVSKMSIRK